MKRFLTAAFVAGLCAAPALSGTMTLSFANEDGETQVWTLNDADGTATSGELTVPYTWNEETRELCAKTDDGDLCATIEDTGKEPEVGGTATYTTSTGESGTVTIMAMSE